jgi:hypothetical protein
VNVERKLAITSNRKILQALLKQFEEIQKSIAESGEKPVDPLIVLLHDFAKKAMEAKQYNLGVLCVLTHYYTASKGHEAFHQVFDLFAADQELADMLGIAIELFGTEGDQNPEAN